MTTKNLLPIALLLGVLTFSNFIGTGKKAGYYLNSDTSVAEWRGAGKAVTHTGSFSVSSEDIIVENGMLTGGSFVIPIASIKNFDLPEEVKPILLNHLKSADFFNMDLYPEAKFVIMNVEPFDGETKTDLGAANYMITGDFTMLNQTHSLSFPAKINVDNKKMNAEAIVKLDRTKWGMIYGADEALGDHYIYPTVDIHLKLFADKNN